MRPYVTFEGSLCDAIQHPIPLIMLPTHTQDTVYPLPSVNFRLFDYSDVPEVGHFYIWLLIVKFYLVVIVAVVCSYFCQRN